jgi:multidrug efflux pump subunit AcrB
MENGYRRMLNGFMKARWMAIPIILVCVAIIYFMGRNPAI